MELDQVLRRFYAEAWAKDGKLYNRFSILAVRNAIERFLNNPPHNRGIKITKGKAFQLSSKMLNFKIKVQKKDSKENMKHKPAIPPGDLEKLSASGVIHGDTPLGLLRNVWFNTSLYWCRRGLEGQRELCADSFAFEVDEDCCPYARMNVDEATKNHPSGIVDVQSLQIFGRMYQTPTWMDYRARKSIFPKEMSAVKLSSSIKKEKELKSLTMSAGMKTDRLA